MALKHARVGAGPEGEPIVGRMTELAVEVGVFDNGRAARPDRSRHLLQEIERTTQVLKEVAAEVVRTRPGLLGSHTAPMDDRTGERRMPIDHTMAMRLAEAKGTL